MTEAERIVFDMMVAFVLDGLWSERDGLDDFIAFRNALTRVQSERARPVVERTFEGAK